MTGPSRVVERIRINGVSAFGIFGENVVAGSITMATNKPPTINVVLLDRTDMSLTERVRDLLNEGTTVSWWNDHFLLTSFTTGGGTDAPTIELSAVSEPIRKLMDHKEANNWGTRDVGQWAEQLIRLNHTKSLVQEDLGDRPLEQQADDQVPENGESLWDVLAEAAKQVGAWVFSNGDRIVFAKPSWLAKRPDLNTLSIHWNSWHDHSEGLIAAPQYTWDHEAKPWDGKEELRLELMDAPGGPGDLLQLRPGDLVRCTGRAVPSSEPEWLVTQVEYPLVVGEPVSVICWRPVDPPEITDDSPAGGTVDGVSVVPEGPIGRQGWKGEQLENAAAIVKEGQRRGLPKIGMVLAVMTAMQESSLINTPQGDHAGPDSCGLFQQRDPWGPRSVRMNPAGAAGLFYDKLEALHYQQIKDPTSASRLINQVQISAHPDAYAVHWDDAHLIVDACIEANRAAIKAAKATGPLGARIDKVMAKLAAGGRIDNDGNGAWCVDLADAYAEELMGIRATSIFGDGKDYYKNPALMGKFTPVPAGRPMRKGDIVTWSGEFGSYTNYIEGLGYGAGHVAIFHEYKNGSPIFLTQNPTPPIITPLSPLGIIGMMRPKG